MYLRGLWAALVLIVPIAFSQAADEPLGRKPASFARPLSNVPNEAAIVARIWVPGHDEGFVPQGLSFSEGQLILSSYRSTDPKQDRGPCRLYFVSPSTGATDAELDLPANCGHAGGVSVLPDGRTVVADTHTLFVLKDRRVLSSSQLVGELKGSFADADATHLWIGSHERGDGKLWRLPVAALERPFISGSDAEKVLRGPPRMQGLTFDHHGQMWITTSGSREGALLRIDANTGQVRDRYDMPAGIEDITFDNKGMLWAVSEAGSIRWSEWPTHFPLIFAIDTTRLR